MLTSDRSMPHVFVDARFRLERKGGDRCRFELARHLAQVGSNFSFLGYDDTANQLRAATVGCEVISTKQRPWHHPSGDLFEHIQIPRIGRRIGADIYHGTFGVLPSLSGTRPAPRMVVTIHDVAVFKMPEAYSRRFCKLGRFLTRRAVSRADRIIAISTATRADLLELFPSMADKISVILNGVGEEFLQAADLPLTRVREVTRRLKLPDQYVLFVGNLERKKNLPRLLAAFAQAKASARLPHRLVIVGQKPDGVPDAGISTPAINELAVFTGYLLDEDLPAIYRGAELIAYPSLYEGFGMPVAEGLAAGVPVLTSAISSMPEVAGGAAMLVDPLSVESIASGISTALTDAEWRRDAKIRGMAQARRLSWAVNARQTAEIYEDLFRN